MTDSWIPASPFLVSPVALQLELFCVRCSLGSRSFFDLFRGNGKDGLKYCGITVTVDTCCWNFKYFHFTTLTVQMRGENENN